MIEVFKKNFGELKTNCYIIKNQDHEIVIDPGVDASYWIKEKAKNVIAILNTHGHWDHIYDNSKTKEIFPNAKLIFPAQDAFMLTSQRDVGVVPTFPDIQISNDKVFTIRDLEISFTHFPGHSPGCYAITIDKYMFSGDFIFFNTIGRVDLPYSNPMDMIKSLQKFSKIKYQKNIYPGHGQNSTIKDEQKNITLWIKQLQQI